MNLAESLPTREETIAKRGGQSISNHQEGQKKPPALALSLSESASISEEAKIGTVRRRILPRLVPADAIPLAAE